MSLRIAAGSGERRISAQEKTMQGPVDFLGVVVVFVVVEKLCVYVVASLEIALPKISIGTTEGRQGLKVQ